MAAYPCSDELKREIDSLVAENEELKQLLQLLQENQELKSILHIQYNESSLLPASNGQASDDIVPVSYAQPDPQRVSNAAAGSSNMPGGYSSECPTPWHPPASPTNASPGLQLQPVSTPGRVPSPIEVIPAMPNFPTEFPPDWAMQWQGRDSALTPLTPQPAPIVAGSPVRWGPFNFSSSAEPQSMVWPYSSTPTDLNQPALDTHFPGLPRVLRGMDRNYRPPPLQLPPPGTGSPPHFPASQLHHGQAQVFTYPSPLMLLKTMNLPGLTGVPQNPLDAKPKDRRSGERQALSLTGSRPGKASDDIVPVSYAQPDPQRVSNAAAGSSNMPGGYSSECPTPWHQLSPINTSPGLQLQSVSTPGRVPSPIEVIPAMPNFPAEFPPEWAVRWQGRETGLTPLTPQAVPAVAGSPVRWGPFNFSSAEPQSMVWPYSSTPTGLNQPALESHFTGLSRISRGMDRNYRPPSLQLPPASPTNEGLCLSSIESGSMSPPLSSPLQAAWAPPCTEGGSANAALSPQGTSPTAGSGTGQAGGPIEWGYLPPASPGLQLQPVSTPGRVPSPIEVIPAMPNFPTELPPDWVARWQGRDSGLTPLIPQPAPVVAGSPVRWGPFNYYSAQPQPLVWPYTSTPAGLNQPALDTHFPRIQRVLRGMDRNYRPPPLQLTHTGAVSSPQYPPSQVHHGQAQLFTYPSPVMLLKSMNRPGLECPAQALLTEAPQNPPDAKPKDRRGGERQALSLTGSKPGKDAKQATMERIVGEIAFQLDRRILSSIFPDRVRLYGFTVSNIPEKIAQAGSDPMAPLSDEQRNGMMQRYANIMNQLKPLGYDPDIHPAFTEYIVNTYGILRERPDTTGTEGDTFNNPEYLQSVLNTVVPPEKHRDCGILLTCLAHLSQADGKPLFIW